MAESDDQDPTEKEFDPTGTKLARARDGGDVPKSQEIGTALSLLALTILVFNAKVLFLDPLVEMVHELWTVDRLRATLHGASVIPIVAKTIARIVLPFAAALGAAGIFFHLVQTGFTLPSGEEAGLKLDFSKLDVVKNIKQKFGLRMALDALKNILKLVLVATVLVYSGRELFLSSGGLLLMPLSGVIQALSYKIGVVVARITLVIILIVVVDYVLERFQFRRRMRMSKQDIKDEMKSQEGDPQIKARRRRKQIEVANRTSMESVGDATVLVANPTHFSVTLRYRQDKDRAPIVLGKGQDRIALKMRERAVELGVPIVENKPLARTLHAVAVIGEPIPVDLYEQVAEVLALVMNQETARAN